ncbi:transcription factor iws1 [Armillaria luteobubalina]|uniref:Transcription factor iws1 n=1 Tax=Armillaria luteobubalina TaxID=153913 RepID=A0AA39URX7_9AGAR|nr:transcription factor iws1 [Armillaria luteobubalina]
MAATKEKLARDIFGGSDSELSSDEEEEGIQNQLQGKQRRDDYESSGPDSEDDYGRQDKPKKRKTIKKKKSSDVREEVGSKRKRGTKKKEPTYTEEDLNDLPPEQGAKIRLDMQFDAILKPKKSSRPKKRKNNDEVLDSFADDEVARLREAMNNAADEDIRSNHDKIPATAKLRLLPEAMETLRKASLAQSMIDNNLLEGALNIQREFFPILKKMEFIDSAVLKESGLGRIVVFYTKCKRVTPDIARIASELVSTWSRPIIKRSASYRDRIVPVARDDGDATGGRFGGEKLGAILARAKESEKGRVRKNAVTVPQSELGNYTVAPRANAALMRANTSVDVDVERRRKNAERLRALTRKVAMRG